MTSPGSSTVSPGFQQPAPREILRVGPPDRHRHGGCGDSREAGRLTTVLQRHPRRTVRAVLPQVDRLHREWPLLVQVGRLVRTVAGDDVAAAGAGYPDRRGGGRRSAARRRHGSRRRAPARTSGRRPCQRPARGRPVDVSGAGECGVLRPVDPSWSGPIPNLTHMTIAAGPMRTSGAERFCRRPGHAGRCHRSSLDHAAGLLASERASASSGATMLREREPGENPGLSRSGMQERPPSWK